MHCFSICYVEIILQSQNLRLNCSENSWTTKSVRLLNSSKPHHISELTHRIHGQYDGVLCSQESPSGLPSSCDLFVLTWQTTLRDNVTSWEEQRGGNPETRLRLGSARNNSCSLPHVLFPLWAPSFLTGGLFSIKGWQTLCKGPESKYVILCGPYNLCRSCSALTQTICEQECGCVPVRLYKNRWWARTGLWAIPRLLTPALQHCHTHLPNSGDLWLKIIRDLVSFH